MTIGLGRRRRLTRDERRQVWRQWRAGTTLEAITAGLAVSASCVHHEVQVHGGIAPPGTDGTARHLTRPERELLAQWRVGEPDGIKQREAARRLGRAASTISREIQRNGARTATTRHYDAATADDRAWRRARRPKPCALARRARLRRVVAARLAANWSPAQISGWLRVTYPTTPAMQLSAETIYRSLYVQARGVLRQELTRHLRLGRSMRRSGARTGRHSRIVDAISISARPPEVADRAIPGHWEGDLLAGTTDSFIATLVERASRYVVLVRVPGKDSASVVDALVRAAQRLPAGMIRSLTWDRGTELAQHRRFSVATDIQVYFCDPHSPWQRGTNENTNGLLRQYFPKGMDVSGVPQRRLDAVAHQLNTRPRQTLGWQTPAAALSRLMRGVALTG
jgi:IS30 family transposase